MKNEITLTTLTHLDKLQVLAAEVMQTFTWYFVKVYWHHRVQLKLRLPMATAEATIRTKIENQQLNPFLDHLEQLIIQRNGVKIATPIPILTHSDILDFLETRLAALTLVAVTLSNPIAAHLAIPLWQNMAAQLLQKTQQLRQQFLLCKTSLPLNLAIQLHPDRYQFSSTSTLHKSITLHQCKGVICFDHLPAGTTLQVTDSPQLTLQLVDCHLSQLMISGDLNHLTMRRTQVDQLQVQATIDSMDLQTDSQAMVTLNRANIRQFIITQSKAQLYLSQTTRVDQLIIGSLAIVQFNSCQSQVIQLQSSGYIQGRMSETQLSTLDLSHCDCTYLTWVNTEIQTLINPTTGGYQRIEKDGRCVAYYASQELAPDNQTALCLTGIGEHPAIIHRMSELLDPQVLHDHLQLPLDRSYNSAHYADEKRKILNKQLNRWGLFLLSQGINPQQCCWQIFCWHYSHTQNWYDKNSQLSRNILNLSFKKFYQEQLESGQIRNKNEKTLFSLLLTDEIIVESNYNSLQIARYNNEKQTIGILLNVMLCLRNYQTSHPNYQKQLVLQEFIDGYRNIIFNLRLTHAEKIAILLERLLAFQTVNDALLKKGYMLCFLLKICITTLELQQQLTLSVGLILDEINNLFDQYSDNSLVKKAKYEFKNNLKKLSVAEATAQTIQTMKRSLNSPTEIKDKLNQSANCEYFETIYLKTRDLAMILNQCKQILDNYRAVFSWFGTGKKKKSCIYYLSHFIHNEQKTLQQRFTALQHKLDYLRQVVAETNVHSRQITLINSVSLWHSRSRQYRGYQATLNRVQHLIDQYREPKVKTSEIIQVDVGQTLLGQSQNQFFQEKPKRDILCSPTVLMD